MDHDQHAQYWLLGYRGERKPMLAQDAIMTHHSMLTGMQLLLQLSISVWCTHTAQLGRSPMFPSGCIAWHGFIANTLQSLLTQHSTVMV